MTACQPGFRKFLCSSDAWADHNDAKFSVLRGALARNGENGQIRAQMRLAGSIGTKSGLAVGAMA